MSKKDTFKDDAKAILLSSRLPSLNFPSSENWEVPSRTKYIYYRLKSNANYFLNIDEGISIEKIKADLASVFKLKGVGKEHFQKESKLKDFDIPPAIYLEYLRGDQSEQDWPKDFYIGYILLAMLDVIEFETIMTSLSSNISHYIQNADGVILIATNVLMDAQVSLELGISGYEKSRGDSYVDRYKYIQESYSAAIRAENKRKKSNKKRSDKSRKKWRPLILEVIDMVGISATGVSNACLEIISKYEMSTSDAEVLRRNYYKYREDPENY